MTPDPRQHRVMSAQPPLADGLDHLDHYETDDPHPRRTLIEAVGDWAWAAWAAIVRRL